MTELRKPITRRTAATVAHGYTPSLVVTLRPGGLMELREARSRRQPVAVDLGRLYVKLRIEEALSKRAVGARRKRGAR